MLSYQEETKNREGFEFMNNWWSMLRFGSPYSVSEYYIKLFLTY